MKLKSYLAITLIATVLISCSDGDDIVDNIDNTPTIWKGSLISFEKLDNADPNLSSNQDRITDNVWITRGNDGGQIYNIAKENISDKNSSPVDTEWALGTLDDIESLTFNKFRRGG